MYLCVCVQTCNLCVATITFVIILGVAIAHHHADVLLMPLLNIAVRIEEDTKTCRRHKHVKMHV